LGLGGRKKQETEEHFIMKYYMIRTPIYLYTLAIKSRTLKQTGHVAHIREQTATAYRAL